MSIVQLSLKPSECFVYCFPTSHPKLWNSRMVLFSYLLTSKSQATQQTDTSVERSRVCSIVRTGLKMVSQTGFCILKSLRDHHTLFCTSNNNNNQRNSCSCEHRVQFFSSYRNKTYCCLGFACFWIHEPFKHKQNLCSTSETELL